MQNNRSGRRKRKGNNEIDRTDGGDDFSRRLLLLRSTIERQRSTRHHSV